MFPCPRKETNHRNLSLSQIASKIYNRLILNSIRPVIDGFRPGRSTSSHLLALRRILEELRNHKKEAVITFIDFEKAFDLINRFKRLKIHVARGILSEIHYAIRVMYENTSALVVTPEGNTYIFQVDTGVLQEDSLAPFLLIICLDYTISISVFPSDGLTLKRKEVVESLPRNSPNLLFLTISL